MERVNLQWFFKLVKLPRYSREFTVCSGFTTVFILLVGGLGLFLTSLLIKIDSPNELKTALINTQDFPFANKTHINLIQTYISLQQYELAQKEIDVVKFLNSPLSAYQTGSNELAPIEEGLLNLLLFQTKLNNYWTTVINKYPDYKEGLIMLMYLARNQNNLKNLEEFRNRLKMLNPNYLDDLPQELLTN